MSEFNFEKYDSVAKNMDGETFLADVANHCKQWSYYGDSDDDITNAHEGTHGVNAQVRNESGRAGVNGFYVFNNRSIVLDEPKCRKQDALPFVTEPFRKSRFGLYMQGQSDWDGCPLYVFDEWVAYTNGALAGIDLYKRGQYKSGHQDVTYGAVEFIVYGLAVTMAANKVNDLSDLLKAFTCFQVRRAMNAYYAGKGIWSFGEDELVEMLLTKQEGQPYRAFAREVLKFSLPTEPVPEDGGPDRLKKDLFMLI